MQLKDFIGKVVISTHTKRRFLLHEITAPKIVVKTEKPGPTGYPQFFSWETIDGDPISKGSLVFEDSSLTEPFKAAYQAYCRTEDACWEEFSYWMRKD